MWAGFAGVLPTQTAQVLKGAYKTRKEALGSLEKALVELYEKARTGPKKGM